MQYQLHSLEKDITDYLIKEKGYDPSEFEIIDSSLGTLPFFSVDVMFNDEPSIYYIYTKDGSVYQVDVATFDKDSNASKMDKTQLKHYDPLE